MKKKNNINIFITTFMLLLLNTHSKHIDLGITQKQKKIIKNPIFRDILIFLFAYTSCDNIYLSILILILYSLFFDHLINEKSIIGKKLFSNKLL